MEKINYSILDGEGLRVFIDDDFGMKEVAELIIDDALPNFSLSGGIAGIAWALKIKYKDKADVTEFLPGIRYFVDAYSKLNDFDYLYGSTGAVAALLEIDPSSIQIVNKYLGNLKKNRITLIDGRFAWKAMDEHYGIVIPFGMAHGVNAIACTIVDIIKKFGDTNNAKSLLGSLISLILLKAQNKLTDKDKLIGADSSVYGVRSNDRLAWCYGDACDLIAFLKANEILKNKEIHQQIINISEKIMKIEDNHRISNTCLCHGSVGLALICHILSEKYSYMKDLKAVSEHWLSITEKTLNSVGIENLKFDKEELAHSGLTGRIGVRIGIATLKGEINADWTRMLMLY